MPDATQTSAITTTPITSPTLVVVPQQRSLSIDDVMKTAYENPVATAVATFAVGCFTGYLIASLKGSKKLKSERERLSGELSKTAAAKAKAEAERDKAYYSFGKKMAE